MCSRIQVLRDSKVLSDMLQLTPRYDLVSKIGDGVLGFYKEDGVVKLITPKWSNEFPFARAESINRQIGHWSTWVPAVVMINRFMERSRWFDTTNVFCHGMFEVQENTLAIVTREATRMEVMKIKHNRIPFSCTVSTGSLFEIRRLLERFAPVDQPLFQAIA